jgi:hypothetical protein
LRYLIQRLSKAVVADWAPRLRDVDTLAEAGSVDSSSTPAQQAARNEAASASDPGLTNDERLGIFDVLMMVCPSLPEGTWTDSVGVPRMRVSTQ